MSTTALYNKLDRVETAVAAALVRDSARLAEPGGRTRCTRSSPVGAWLYVKVLDGNHLASTEHRLQELRGTWAAPSPAKRSCLGSATRVLTDRLDQRMDMPRNAAGSPRCCIASVRATCGSRTATFAPWG